LRHYDVELPRSWVQSLDEAGILLNVPKERVDALPQGPGRSEQGRLPPPA